MSTHGVMRIILPARGDESHGSEMGFNESLV